MAKEDEDFTGAHDEPIETQSRETKPPVWMEGLRLALLSGREAGKEESDVFDEWLLRTGTTGHAADFLRMEWEMLPEGERTARGRFGWAVTMSLL